MLSRSLIATLALLAVSASAFAPMRHLPAALARSSSSSQQRGGVTALQERRWNFNEGQSPWGLKANAEIWNGRVVRIRFAVSVIVRNETKRCRMERH